MGRQIAGIDAENAGERPVYYEQAMRRAEQQHLGRHEGINANGAVRGDFNFVARAVDRFEASALDPDLSSHLQAWRDWMTARGR